MKAKKILLLGLCIFSLAVTVVALADIPATASATASATSHSATTTVFIKSINTTLNSSVVLPIMITNVSEAGVSASRINLTYNPGVVNVLAVKNSSFELSTSNINNTVGFTKVIGFQMAAAGLVGDVKVADIEFQAVGEQGEVSPLNLEVIELNNDLGVSIQHEVKNGTFRIIDENNAPLLENGTVEPGAGYFDTSFTYKVSYKDLDNDPPSFIHLIIDNSSLFEMSVVEGEEESERNYTKGVRYEHELTGSELGVGRHTYKFEASDGRLNATLEGLYSNEVLASFDTGTPENPYPSIAGTHNGTISPNKTIKVRRLYTFPCPGTGGHSEYVRIWNSTGWNVSARWVGYCARAQGEKGKGRGRAGEGDWRNIYFEENFTLHAGKEYNYSILTGSYPKIWHTGRLEVANGAITCEQFVDKNGKVYKDRLPTIILGV